MPRSQAERLWMIGGALVGFVMLLLGYVLFISPQRSTTDSVDSQVQSVQSANDVLQAKLDKLRAENQNLAHYQALAANAQLALPATSGLSAFLRELQQIGGATRTDVTTLQAGTPLDVSTVLGTPQAPSTSSSSSAPAAASNLQATSNTASGSTTTPAAISTGPKVYALPISATVAGSVGALNQFLTQLQAVQPRAVLITELVETNQNSNAASATAKGQASSNEPTLQLTMYAFVAPSTGTSLQPTAGK